MKTAKKTVKRPIRKYQKPDENNSNETKGSGASNVINSSRDFVKGSMGSVTGGVTDIMNAQTEKKVAKINAKGKSGGKGFARVAEAVKRLVTPNPVNQALRNEKKEDKAAAKNERKKMKLDYKLQMAKTKADSNRRNGGSAGGTALKNALIKSGYGKGGPVTKKKK